MYSKMERVKIGGLRKFWNFIKSVRGDANYTLLLTGTGINWNVLWTKSKEDSQDCGWTATTLLLTWNGLRRSTRRCVN